MNNPRKRLSEILPESARKSYFAGWKDVKAAPEFGPLPKGEYNALLVDGNVVKAGTGTLSYKLVFQVTEGEFAGRKVWHDIWLTEAARPQAKRDFDRLGITDPERQLDGPPPQGLLVKVSVVIHKDDDGTQRNKVRWFEVVGVEPPDPYAPGKDEVAEPEGTANISSNPAGMNADPPKADPPKADGKKTPKKPTPRKRKPKKGEGQ